MSEPRVKGYITFGQLHTHSVHGRTFDKDCVAEFEGRDHIEIREKAFKYFGDQWHNCYDEPSIKAADNRIMKYFPRGIIPVEADAASA